MSEKLYLINEETGLIFNHNEYMATLPNMRECDAKGNQFTKPMADIEEVMPSLPTDTDNSGDEVTVELESLHWTKLKALVQDAGGEYDNKADAIAFLRGE